MKRKKKRPRVFVWTGGQPADMRALRACADALPALPAPTYLRRAAQITYQWGPQRFEIQAAACSLRSAPWGDKPVTWLHCKARPTAEIWRDETTNLTTALIPAAYITDIRSGMTFRLWRVNAAGDLGVFPPNYPAPAGALSLPEVERALAELLAPERN